MRVSLHLLLYFTASPSSPEDLCRELERQVNVMIEESSIANHRGHKDEALEKAKEAGKKERQLCREREKNGLADQINSDLTYAVCFNLANQYGSCGMHQEALNTYSLIVKVLSCLLTCVTIANSR